jgi:hypothetical protein
MKKLILSSILALALSPAVFAEKIEGEVTCAKCDLKTADKCQAVVQVKGADGKPVTYTVTGAKAGEIHKAICKGGKDGTAEGTVSEKDGKKSIDVASYTLK